MQLETLCAQRGQRLGRSLALAFAQGEAREQANAVAQPQAVRFAIAGDALWIIGSIAVLLFARSGLTLTGIGLIVVAAAVVVDVLLVKQIGLGRQQRAALA